MAAPPEERDAPATHQLRSPILAEHHDGVLRSGSDLGPGYGLASGYVGWVQVCGWGFRGWGLGMDGAGGGSVGRVTSSEPGAMVVEFAGEFDLESVEVDGGRHGGVVGDGRIDDSILRNVDLSGAKLGPLTLARTVLQGVDLSNASLQQVVARRARLSSCRAIGLRLSVEYASELVVEDCRLDYAVVHLEKVKGGARFSGCSFREATIGGDLSGVSFSDCDFVDTEFRAVRAARCDLRGSRIDSARGLLSLRGAMISAEQAVSASIVIAAEAGLVVGDEGD
jgi:hypothetical protein